MQRYDKLVRDKIPEIIADKGGESKSHIAGQKEYQDKLKAKLSEEVAEFLESDNPEELADIMEVIYALGELLGVNKEELERMRSEKAEKRGGFSKRIILEES